MTIGQRLKELRKSLGKKQTEMGRLLGIAQTYYSRYERDLVSPKATTIAKLKEETGVSTDWLLTGEGEMFSRKESDEVLQTLSTQERELLEEFRRLSEERQEIYCDRIKADALEERLKRS